MRTNQDETLEEFMVRIKKESDVFFDKWYIKIGLYDTYRNRRNMILQTRYFEDHMENDIQEIKKAQGEILELMARTNRNACKCIAESKIPYKNNE